MSLSYFTFLYKPYHYLDYYGNYQFILCLSQLKCNPKGVRASFGNISLKFKIVANMYVEDAE